MERLHHRTPRRSTTLLINITHRFFNAALRRRRHIHNPGTQFLYPPSDVEHIILDKHTTNFKKPERSRNAR
jgi:hypothetical protein